MFYSVLQSTAFVASFSKLFLQSTIGRFLQMQYHEAINLLTAINFT